MADLSMLDPTQPPDTQAVSQGALRIRETRDATITSFNVEHDLTGPHTFIAGAPGLRPAAGFVGRVFFDTTNGRVERDTGSAWNMLNCVQVYSSAVLDFPLPAGAFGVISNLTIDADAGAKIFVVGSFRASNYANTVSARITLDAVALNPGTQIMQLEATETAHMRVFGVSSSAMVTSGVHTVAMQGFVGGGVAGTAFGAWLGVLVA